MFQYLKLEQFFFNLISQNKPIKFQYNSKFELEINRIGIRLRMFCKLVKIISNTLQKISNINKKKPLMQPNKV